MGRSSIALRSAVATDVEFLADLWCDAVRRADRAEQVADLEAVVKRAGASLDERVVVAEYDGERAGAVLLRVGTVSALNLEPAVHVVSPHVALEFRRRGVGRVLMDAAVAFGDEMGVETMVTAVSTGARESNRFMARLALGPLATLRIAPVAAVGARVSAQRPGAGPVGAGRERTRLLAARRSLRRSRATG